VDGEVLNAEAFVEVGHRLGDCIDHVGDLIADYEFDILYPPAATFAARWSPINKPSLILIGPSRNSIVVWAYLNPP
jgi:hypothetical protein